MKHMNYYRFEDLKAGRTEQFTVTVDGNMQERFCELTGDTNPLHTDEAYAVSQGFEGRVVYGMLTASFLSALAGVFVPGAYGILHSVEVKFVKPVYAPDVLKVTGTVTELNETVRQAVIKVEIRNQKGEKVLRGKIKAGVLNET